MVKRLDKKVKIVFIQVYEDVGEIGEALLVAFLQPTDIPQCVK